MADNPTPCGVCALVARGAPLFENEHWQLRHADAPYGVAGWMMLLSRRHVAGPAHFDDREAADFGLTLRRTSSALLQASGALRVYLAAMGESHPHFHCHLVPRMAETPNGVKAWGLFDLQRAAGAGEVRVDEAEVRRISAEVVRRLAIG
jgi:diadenosine tetraphosphate (Ap4A) HIT family hydrolase